MKKIILEIYSFILENEVLDADNKQLIDNIEKYNAGILSNIFNNKENLIEKLKANEIIISINKLKINELIKQLNGN